MAATLRSAAPPHPPAALLPCRATQNPDFLKQVKTAFPTASTKFILACQTGRRSEAAAKLLGPTYPQMVESKDGYVAWVAAGLPTTS